MTEENVILLVIVLYLAALVAIGLWSARHAKGRKAFFLAGRQLGTVGTTATLSATVIGGSATIVAVIKVFYSGMALVWFTVAGGVTVTVNLGEKPHTCSDGYSLEPMQCRAEGLPDNN